MFASLRSVLAAADCFHVHTIQDVLMHDTMDHGDLVGFVVDVSSKRIVWRTGQSKEILQISVVDQSCELYPLVLELSDENLIRSLRHRIIRGCVVCAFSFARHTSRDGKVFMRAGIVHPIYLKNMSKLAIAFEESMNPSIQHSIATLGAWVASSQYSSLIRYECAAS
jgi:hypothetical protein